MIIIISDEAKIVIERARDKKKVPSSFFLRVGVQRGGCAGISHQLGFDELKENDDRFIFNSIEVVIDKRHQPFLDNLEISYAEIDKSKQCLPYDGINFYNPNAGRRCGCGNSFNVV